MYQVPSAWQIEELRGAIAERVAFFQAPTLVGTRSNLSPRALLVSALATRGSLVSFLGGRIKECHFKKVGTTRASGAGGQE